MRTLLTEQNVNEVMEEKYCIIYARSESQNMIDYQIKVCEEYAESKGYTVIGKIVDKHGIANRNEAITEAESGNYNVFIAMNASRIGRRLYDVVGFISQLEALDVKVEVVNLE